MGKPDCNPVGRNISIIILMNISALLSNLLKFCLLSVTLLYVNNDWVHFIKKIYWYLQQSNRREHSTFGVRRNCFEHIME